jgi:Protein of unknown function (DUF1579)
MTTQEAQPQAMTKAEPQKEHEWLQKLVGEWTYEMESPLVPSNPPTKVTGTERVRSLGGLWVLGQAEGETSECDMGTTLMTLGYDPQKQRYVGTFLGSTMTYLWVYEGELDAAERALTLNCDGPSFEVEGKMAKYKDVIEFQDDDHRTLTAHMLGEDGQWHEFMTTHYRRKT